MLLETRRRQSLSQCGRHVAELCLMVVWKTELGSDELGNLADEI